MAGSQPCVLLVDDEDAILHSTRLILQRHGYVVLTATNAADAIALFTANHIDVAIIDFGVTRSESAFLPAVFKASRPKVKTILFSGYSEAAHHMDGVDMLLPKPAFPREFLKAIADVLAVAASASAGGANLSS